MQKKLRVEEMPLTMKRILSEKKAAMMKVVSTRRTSSWAGASCSWRQMGLDRPPGTICNQSTVRLLGAYTGIAEPFCRHDGKTPVGNRQGYEQRKGHRLVSLLRALRAIRG